MSVSGESWERPDPREAKLPLWAKDRIAVARQAARRYKDRLNDHIQTLTKSNTSYGDRFCEPDSVKYLPDDERVRFSFGDSVLDSITVSRDQDRPGAIEIMGGRGVSITARASNHLLIELRD